MFWSWTEFKVLFYIFIDFQRVTVASSILKTYYPLRFSSWDWNCCRTNMRKIQIAKNTIESEDREVRNFTQSHTGLSYLALFRNRRKQCSIRFVWRNWIFPHRSCFVCACVNESNNVLQAVQTNQTLFIKLGNKRNVLRCLTESKLRKTPSNIVKHGGQTSKICFIKQCWMMFFGDVLLVWTGLYILWPFLLSARSLGTINSRNFFFFFLRCHWLKTFFSFK